MARYYDDARILANLIKDKNKLKSQISKATDIVQIGKSDREFLNVRTILVKQTKRDPEDWGHAFVVGHPVNGKIGNGNLGEDGLQIRIGADNRIGAITMIQREHEWNTSTLLGLGTKSDNIDITNGDIRLG